jgi:hypothetical protein
MKRSILFIFLSIFPTLSYSQAFITGTAVDSKTKESIECVYVKNRNQYEYIAFSKADGSFSIYANMNDTIEFFRLGYETKTIVSKNDGNIFVEMTPKAYMLDEVVVTFEDAYNIYNKSVDNLRNKYLNGASVYLWHGIESWNNKENESYAMYVAKFDLNKTKKSYSFDLRLMELNHLKEQNKKPVLSGIPFHGINTVQLKKEDRRRFIKVNSEDDSLICLQELLYVKKIKETVAVDIVINKADTVLLYVKVSGDTIVKDLKFLGIKVGSVTIENNTVNISYKRENGYCYLDEFYMKTIGSMVYNDSTKQDLKVEYLTKFLHVDDSPEGRKLKKLTGQIKQLYQLKSTTSEEFWKQYIK